MTTYHVEPSGNRFVVVAVKDDVRLKLFPAFPTREEAEQERVRRSNRFLLDELRRNAEGVTWGNC